MPTNILTEIMSKNRSVARFLLLLEFQCPALGPPSNSFLIPKSKLNIRQFMKDCCKSYLIPIFIKQGISLYSQG